VFVECEYFSVIASEDFVDAIAEEDASVEPAWAELFGRQDFVLYHRYFHKLSLKSSFCRISGAYAMVRMENIQ